MEKDLNFTNEEKIDFLVNLNTINKKNKVDITLNPSQASLFVTLPFELVLGTINAMLLLVSIGNPLATVCASIFSAISLATPIYCDIKSRKQQKNLIKKLSNNKLNTKTYFKLIESGELENWKQQFANEVNAKVNEINGIKVEEYKQKAENEIIYSVYNALPEEKGITLDSNQIAKKIVEIIEENNKNNLEK